MGRSNAAPQRYDHFSADLAGTEMIVGHRTSPTKSQEGAPPDALEVRSVAYGEALSFALA
jgi:hypothetical protein